jgi:uncharacterized membrane protein
MSDFGNAKVLGGVGAIIMLIGGFIFPLLGIVGLIMVLLAVKAISEAAKDNTIYKNFVMFIVMQIIAIVALFAMIFIAFGGFAFYAATAEITDYTAFTAGLGASLAICVVAFIVAYILYILAALYLKKSFEGITNYTKVDLFKTTGLVYFIGAILMIIGIGFFLIFIAEILMIVAFFSLPDKLPGPGGTGQSGRICPACGRPIPMDAQVCPYCGKNFAPPK